MKISIKEEIKKVNFGDIDGLYDPNINEYFLDFEFWDKIVNKNQYFVIGRKGTGKSALYNWVHDKQSEAGILVSNLSFNQFPFEKFLKLTDDDFSKPNQYQSIWRNIILSEIANLIVKDQNSDFDPNYKIIAEYVDHFFGKGITDLHKEIARIAEKTTVGIGLRVKKILGFEAKQEWSNGLDISDGISNITMINRKLQGVIEEYLKTHNNTSYIIQFDQLDDNYTVYLNNKEYFQSIISLFKTVYDINQSFRRQSINVKSVIYLRSDIYYSIDSFDSESARWDQFRLNLNYSIVNRTDWFNPKLLQILNKRITNSIPELSAERNSFDVVFDKKTIDLKENGKHQWIFRYIVHRTFHRPRDVVQFCIKIQDEVRKTNKFYFRTIKDAEKEYSLWLLSEIANEISPKIGDLEPLYELLRLMGKVTYSMSDFKKRYSRYKKSIGMEDEELLKYLYSFGIIHNVNYKGGKRDMYSIIRNDRSVFNRDLKIQTHTGFYLGLYTSKFTD